MSLIRDIQTINRNSCKTWTMPDLSAQPIFGKPIFGKPIFTNRSTNLSIQPPQGYCLTITETLAHVKTIPKIEV